MRRKRALSEKPTRLIPVINNQVQKKARVCADLVIFADAAGVGCDEYLEKNGWLVWRRFGICVFVFAGRRQRRHLPNQPVIVKHLVGGRWFRSRF
jgi:hypothetical protein